MRVKSKAGCTRYKMSSAGAHCDELQACMLCMIAQPSRSTKQPKRPRRADRTQTCRQSSVTPMMATDIIARWSYRNIPTFAAAHHQASRESQTADERHLLFSHTRNPRQNHKSKMGHGSCVQQQITMVHLVPAKNPLRHRCCM